MKLVQSLKWTLFVSSLFFFSIGNSFAYEIEPGKKIVLRMLVWEGYAPEEYRVIFQKMMKDKYDIEVDFKLDFVSEPEQYLESLRRRAHEVICPTHNIPKSLRWPLIESGLLLPLRTENIPNFKKIVPSLQKTDFLVENGEVYAAPFLHGTYGLAYNSALVEEPTSWRVLWDPKNNGKYSVSSDYPEVNIYIAALAMAIGKKDIANLPVVNTPAFKTHLQALADNAARVWHGIDTVEILSGLTYSTSWGFALADLNAKGEPWKMSNPVEGSPAWVDTWALAAHLKDLPDHRWVAEQWINFVLSDQAQLGYMRSLGATPTNEKVARIATAEEVKKIHVGDRDYFDNLLFWSILPNETQTAYGNMWREAFQ
jgi:spermidine/putrescine-binding protein